MRHLPVFLLGIFITLSSTHISDAEVIDGEIWVDGLKRTYHLFIPDKNKDTSRIPMVIMLHGGGSDGQSMMRFTKFNDLAEDENFLVLYPDGLDRRWNDGREAAAFTEKPDDVKFISTLIDEMTAHHRANSKKVFVTGISNGAIFSLYLASKISNKILAIAAVCGSIPQNYASTYSIPLPISVMIINGTADPAIKYEGGAVLSDRAGRGIVISTDSAIKKLVTIFKCSTIPQQNDFADINLKDHSSATRYVYQNCENKKEIILIKVNGGGHTWPGGFQYLPKSMIGNVCRDFNATSEIWKFFRQQQPGY